MLRLYFYIVLFDAITVNWSLIISLSFVNRQLSIDVRVIEPFLLYVQPLHSSGLNYDLPAGIRAMRGSAGWSRIYFKLFRPASTHPSSSLRLVELAGL